MPPQQQHAYLKPHHSTSVTTCKVRLQRLGGNPSKFSQHCPPQQQSTGQLSLNLMLKVQFSYNNKFMLKICSTMYLK